MERLRTDRAGNAGVEFSMIAPILVLMLFGLVEFPHAYGTSQSLVRAARTAADLISRGSLNDVSDVYAAADAVTYPYDAGASGIVLTAVGVYDQGGTLVAKVCSSTARNATARTVASVIGAPVEAEARAGARYVMAEMTLRYRPIFNIFPPLNALTFAKTVAWPIRGTGANTAVEAVLPGGRPCPVI